LIRNVISKVPGFGGDEKAQEAEDMKAKAYNFNPDNYASEEVQQQFMSILKWRDDLYRDITNKIEMIPGLEGLIDELTIALNTCQSDSQLANPRRCFTDEDQQMSIRSLPLGLA
jgi:hypothetical protein